MGGYGRAKKINQQVIRKDEVYKTSLKASQIPYWQIHANRPTSPRFESRWAKHCEVGHPWSIAIDHRERSCHLCSSACLCPTAVFEGWQRPGSKKGLCLISCAGRRRSCCDGGQRCYQHHALLWSYAGWTFEDCNWSLCKDKPKGSGNLISHHWQWLKWMEPNTALKASGVSLMAPLEALSAIAGAGEGTAVARVIERLLAGLRRGVRCIPESLQNHEITNSNLLASIQVLYPILSPKSLFIDVYRFISVNLFQEVQPSRSLTLLLAAKCRDHRSKIRNSTCATLAAIARGGGKELLGSLGLSAEAESEVLTSVPWLPMVTPMLPQLFQEDLCFWMWNRSWICLDLL